ncbi:surfeit locus 1 family protein [Nitrosomonas sp. PY1]|uniref:SURF1 family protein n=1 Tax=Nitrosomonas sp. PY1 TaxID=1803906 RepID=UPI001FC8B062|nr:SURF1 family protein [Nitrosomonas sp. PY1]GKS70237.1 surfeit locus 1 family protein [Nitrosomonas sp. PY1]
MSILGYRFKPKVWAIILMIAFVLIFSSLGRWQLNRAEEKTEKHEQIQLYTKQPPINLPTELVKLKDFEYREVEIRGEFANDKTILLDNKTYQRRVGYHVITPMKISTSNLYVPINRGWIELGKDRLILPIIQRVEGEVILTGTVISPEIRALTLKEEFVRGMIWDKFDLQRYEDETGLNMQPILVLQKNDVNDGLLRDWDKSDSGASKNIGYAIQWFSLAAATLIIFIVLNVKRSYTKSEIKSS